MRERFAAWRELLLRKTVGIGVTNTAATALSIELSCRTTRRSTAIAPLLIQPLYVVPRLRKARWRIGGDVKTVLFHILNSFRGLIQLALALGAIMAFLLLALELFEHGVTGSALGAAVWFVGLGAARWYYDVLLVKLMPSSRR